MIRPPEEDMSGRSRGRPGTSSEPPALHPDEAWTAVRSRDAGYDGRFVFGADLLAAAFGSRPRPPEP